MTNLEPAKKPLNKKELEAQFEEVILAINHAKSKAYQSVNKESITLYWKIGEYISTKVKANLWGKSIVQNLADFIKTKQPHFRGYSRQNLWRMKQFYEIYNGNTKLSTLLREISWSHNLAIMSRCDTDEEREFYHGCLQASNVLKSDVATEMSVFIIDAFVAMKNQIFSNPNYELLKEQILRLQAETKLINAEMLALKKDHKIDLNVQNMEINDLNEKVPELLTAFNKFRDASIIIKKDDGIGRG